MKKKPKEEMQDLRDELNIEGEYEDSLQDDKDVTEEKKKRKKVTVPDPENSFERQLKRRRRKRRWKTFITLLVLASLAYGGYRLYLYLQKMNTKPETEVSTVTYRVQQVTEGSIRTTVSSTGTMTPVATETEYPVYDDSVVTALHVSLGSTFKKGDVLMELELDDENELVTQLSELEETISTTDRLADSRYLRANDKGYIKDIKFFEGCDITEIMKEYGYIALICLDNRMQVSVRTDALVQYEKVDITVDAKPYIGVVQEVKGGFANIIIESSRPPVGAVAEVRKKDGTAVGNGKMELIAFTQITAVDGYITTVNVKDGQLVRKNDKIALCRDLPTTTQYQELIDQREDLQQQIEDATSIIAPFDGRVLEIDAAAGDTVGTETTLLVLQSLDGYVVSLSVDELDIASLKLGQPATVELDALDGSYEGTLSYISYVNSSSGNTVRYTVQVSVKDIPGALPDMSATCTIITSDSGLGLIIPAEAIQRIDGKSTVYMAPEGARFGRSYRDTEIDVSTLRTADVTVLQSDGSMLLVSGDLKKDDLILIRQLVTNSTYTNTSNSRQNGFGSNMPGGFGNMPGGNWGGNNGSNNNRNTGNNNRSRGN